MGFGEIFLLVTSVGYYVRMPLFVEYAQFWVNIRVYCVFFQFGYSILLAPRNYLPQGNPNSFPHDSSGDRIIIQLLPFVILLADRLPVERLNLCILVGPVSVLNAFHWQQPFSIYHLQVQAFVSFEFECAKLRLSDPSGLTSSIEKPCAFLRPLRDLEIRAGPKTITALLRLAAAAMPVGQFRVPVARAFLPFQTRSDKCPLCSDRRWHI